MATNKTIQIPQQISLITMIHLGKKGNLAVQENLSGSTYYGDGTVIKITNCQPHCSRCFESRWRVEARDLSQQEPVDS